MNKFETIIIGGGASAMMIASRLRCASIAIIEANKTLAKKVEISGGGKCNITNKYVSVDNYLGDKEFVQKVFDKFDNKNLINYLSNKGLSPELKKNNQYFCKNSSKEIINIFANEIKAKIFYDEIVQSVSKQKNDFVITTNKSTYQSKILIIASGGASYKLIGASEIGFDIAKQFGHKINTISPALVGFTVQKEQFWWKNLSGISLECKIRVEDKEFVENVLFAHKGISGPAILSTSLYWKKGGISIDFLPNTDIDKLLSKSDKNIATMLPLPKRFVLEFLESISVENKATKLLSNEEKDKIKTLKNYIFSPAGNFGYTKAEATKGGVDTNEIDENMQSKLVQNLFFVGEVLDVTGELGGYNLQWAFSSGYVCSEYINKLCQK